MALPLVRLITFLCLLAVCMLAWTSPAPASPVVLNAQTEVIDLADDLEVLEDPARTLDISHILTPAVSHHFKPRSRSSINFGYPEGDVWVRFEVSNRTSKDWYLVLDHPLGGDFSLYVLPATGSIFPATLSPLKPIENYRTPAWKLSLPAGETFAAYLRANNGQEILRLPLMLMTEQAFLEHSISRYVFLSAIFASLGVLTLYNLFMAIGLRDVSFFSLMIFYSMLQFAIYRDSNLFPSLAFINDTHSWFYPTGLLLTMAAGMRYWRHVNMGGSEALERLMKGLQWISLAILPIAWMAPLKITYLSTLIILPIMAIMITRVALRGHGPTRNAYFAVITFLVSTSIYISTHIEWDFSAQLNNLFVDIGQAGILTSALLLSISHASRSRELSDAMEHERAIGQAKDEFLTTMSHELRTPMNTVVAAGTLLQKTTLDDKQKLYLAQQEAAARHMLGLIDDILDLSRMENKSVTLRQETFYLVDLLDDLRQIIAGEAESKGFALKLPDKAGDLPCLVGDRQRLSQVLLNLLGNAIKFTHHGEVELIIGVMQATKTGHRRLFFEVRDTGIGIAAEAQQQLFKPFSQVESRRSRHYGGSGLGLAISHKLVAMMGGALEFNSEPGRGSRFFFTLEFPLCPDSSGNKESETKKLTAENPLKGRKILVVEDDKINQFFISELLSSLEVEVTLVEDGETALQTLQQQSLPDLVFMDVSMPGMDGYETTRRIRQDSRLVELPIIALTAHAITGERERCLAAGMSDYLSKPVELAQLRHMLEHWLIAD